MLLSGFVFPIRNMPLPVQYLTYLNPLRYFMEIVRDVFLKGTGLRYLWPQLTALLAFTLVTAAAMTSQIGLQQAVVRLVAESLGFAMHTDARSILGGDVELDLTHQPATADELAWMHSQGKVSGIVQMRSMARAGQEHPLVELKAVDKAYRLENGRLVAG